MFIIVAKDIAKFILNSSINLSASKSCFLLSSKISLVFKFFLYCLLNLFAKPRPDIKLSISASLKDEDSKFSFFDKKYGI